MIIRVRAGRQRAGYNDNQDDGWTHHETVSIWRSNSGDASSPPYYYPNKGLFMRLFREGANARNAKETRVISEYVTPK
jgi:hypothetical protein